MSSALESQILNHWTSPWSISVVNPCDDDGDGDVCYMMPTVWMRLYYKVWALGKW